MWLQLFNELKTAYKALKFLDKAKVLLDKKEYQKSIECLEEGIVVAKQGSEFSNYPLAILYYQTGYTYNQIEEYEKASKYLRKSEKIFLTETGECTLDLAENYAELGLAASGVNDYDSAIVYYKRSTDIYLELNLKDKYSLGWLYSNLGMCYRNKGMLEKSTEYFNKSISIYEKYKEKKGLVLRLKADVCLNNSDYPQALKYRKELLEFRSQKFSSDSFEIMQSFSYIAEVYIKMGDEKNSLQNFEKVVNYRKANNIPNPTMSQVYFGLSRTCRFNKDYTKAIEYLKKSLSLVEQNQSYPQEDIIEFHTELGYLYQKNNDLNNAIEAYQNAFIIFEKLSDKKRSLRFEIFYELAFLYEQKKNRVKANYYFKNLIQIYDESLWQDLAHIANTNRIYGEVWLGRKNSQKAIEYLEKAQSLHLKTVTQNEIRAIATTASNYLNLSKAYRLQKNYTKALENLLSGLSTFLNYTTDEESDLNKSIEDYEKDYIQKNKEFLSTREMNYFLYHYKQLRLNFVRNFFLYLKTISLTKSDYKKVIRFFEKYSKEKPRLSNWCKENIQKLKEIEMKR